MKKKSMIAFLLTAAVSISCLSIELYTKGAGDVLIPGAPVITAEAATPSASALAKAGKKPFGKNLPDMLAIGEDDMKERYGVESDWYSSAYAEVPLISVSVDEIVVFQAKNAASKKKILSAVRNYQNELKKDTMQYPMNQLKIQGSRVYTNGDYVCFIMLGNISSSLEQNGTDAEQIQGYQKLNKKAVKAIKKKLK